MGYSISWFAVRQENAGRFIENLQLTATEEFEEIPESLISTAKLDTGWQILWYSEASCPFLQKRDLQRLSSDIDIIAVEVEEHVMFSSSELWAKGECKWHISHEGENGPQSGVKTEGELPGCFAEIKTEMEECQKREDADKPEVDYIFDIPLLISKSITGFKHDEDCKHLTDNQFAILSRKTSDQKKGIFKRLLGR
jgi:hypothetical protein